jgi:hypothetical protein
VNGVFHHPGNRLPRLSLVANIIVFLIDCRAILGSSAITLAEAGLFAPDFCTP